MKRRVIVIGGGFGGLAAAKSLDRDLFQVTLIDRCNYHLFQPLLYQVATGSLSAADITTPLRMMLGPRGVRVLQEEVKGLDTERRTLETASGRSYPWDVLILAVGLGHSYFGHDEWARFAPGLKNLPDAFQVRNRILRTLEEAEACDDDATRARLLRFVVVGGGPTGVEIAGAISELTRRSVKGEFSTFDPETAEILLIEGEPRILPMYSETGSADALRQLSGLGVRTLLAARVSAIDETGLVIRAESGEEQRLDAATVIWAAGAAPETTARALSRDLGVEPGRGGRIEVDEHFRLPGRDDVFVIGDLARYEHGGTELPGLAPAAEQAGRHVARFLGGHRGAFAYKERGQLAVIGRNAAVGIVLGREVSGPLAWWAWLLIHIVGIIGFDVKLKVMLVWAWKFVFDKFGARLIVEDR